MIRSNEDVASDVLVERGAMQAAAPQRAKAARVIRSVPRGDMRRARARSSGGMRA
jgi:hypothetical protein